MNIYHGIKLSLVTLGCLLYSPSAHAITSETSQETNTEATPQSSSAKSWIVAQGTGTGSPDETFWQTIKDTTLPELFEMYIKQYPNSPRSIEAAKKLQALKTGAASTASEEAEKLINPVSTSQQPASVTRSTTTGETRPETNSLARNSGELSLLIQHNLNRVGCQAGSTDGAFGPRTRAAADRFAKYSGKAFDTNAPNQALLAAVQSAPGIICPPTKSRTVRYSPERIRKNTSRNKKSASKQRAVKRKSSSTPQKARPKPVTTAKKENWGKSFFGGAHSNDGGGGDGGGGDGGGGDGGGDGGGH